MPDSRTTLLFEQYLPLFDLAFRDRFLPEATEDTAMMRHLMAAGAPYEVARGLYGDVTTLAFLQGMTLYRTKEPWSLLLDTWNFRDSRYLPTDLDRVEPFAVTQQQQTRDFDAINADIPKLVKHPKHTQDGRYLELDVKQARTLHDQFWYLINPGMLATDLLRALLLLAWDELYRLTPPDGAITEVGLLTPEHKAEVRAAATEKPGSV